MLKKWFNKNTHSNNGVIRTNAYSLKGHKPTQEDRYYISEYTDRLLAFVADGVGGHAHGDFASATAVDIFKNTYDQNQTFNDIPDFLRKTILVIASLVLQKSLTDPEYKNCGTTISGFFVDNDKYFTFNVGDSRVYHFSQGKLKRMTKDQSVVQELIDKGEITEEEALKHPKRNIMTSAIGQKITMMRIDIGGDFHIEHGDILLAFTDGVHGVLRDNEIEKIIADNYKSPDLAKIIVEKAFEQGSKDNITACFYRHIKK